MEGKRKTLTFLRANDWWWKRKIPQKGPARVGWRAVELAARNYELMRRAPKAKEFTKTYVELNHDERSFIHSLWGSWQKSPFRFANDRRQFEEVGWTPVYGHQHRQWNLNAPDAELKKAFMHDIRIARLIQGIKAPKPLKGKRNRGVSWRYIEMLDRRIHGLGGPLNQSDGRAASKGREMATKLLTEFKRAFAKISPRELHPLERKDAARSEFFNLKL